MTASNSSYEDEWWNRYMSQLAQERVGDDDEPCRDCRGRGYERGNEDEPCRRCAGEAVEP